MTLDTSLTTAFPPTLTHWWNARGISLSLERFLPFWEKLDRGEALESFLAEAKGIALQDPFLLLDAMEAREDWRFLEKRKERILAELTETGKLTPELQELISAEISLPKLEDLALPLRPKNRSKAAMARDAGLEPLAEWVWNCANGTDSPAPGQTLEIWAYTFRNERANYGELEQVLEGTKDLLIERFSQNPELRDFVRKTLKQEGELRAERAANAKTPGRYESLIGAKESLHDLLAPGHAPRYALYRKAWIEEELTLSFGSRNKGEDLFARVLSHFESQAITHPGSPGEPLLKKAAEQALRSHIWNSIETELHRALKESADRSLSRDAGRRAFSLFSREPFGERALLAVYTPPKREQLRIVGADHEGKLLAETSIQIGTETERAQAKVLLHEILQNPVLEGIAIGDGPQGREGERFVRILVQEMGRDLPVFFVTEGGAAEASPRTGEIPPHDPHTRVALELARRAQRAIECARRSPDLRSWLNPWAPPEANAQRLQSELSFALHLAELPEAPKTRPLTFPPAITRLEDLQKGDVLQGVVTNVTSFGAFVDIGIPEQGLLHASRLGRGRFRDPRETVSPGERVDVTVMDLLLEKRQFALVEGAPAPARERRPPPPRRAPPRENKPRDSKPREPRGPENPPRVAARSAPPPVRIAPRTSAQSSPRQSMPISPPMSLREPKVDASPFHNPFASLAALKTQLPKKK